MASWASWILTHRTDVTIIGWSGSMIVPALVTKFLCLQNYSGNHEYISFYILYKFIAYSIYDSLDIPFEYLCHNI